MTNTKSKEDRHCSICKYYRTYLLIPAIKTVPLYKTNKND